MSDSVDRIEFDDITEDINTMDFGDGLEEMKVPIATSALEFGEFILVGHGEVTNDRCGRFSSFWGCLRVELHNRVKMIKIYDSIAKKEKFVSVVNKGYVRKVFYSCDKPSCCVCYKFGWAGRQARKVESRLAEASKRFGQVEHVIVSVPPRFYGLSYDVLRGKVEKALFDRGVIGGFAIFHGFRYNQLHYWYWSPHWHVLCFILGGYGKCRRCLRKRGRCGIENRGCDGFINRSYRCNERDGLIAKVMGRRKTVRGTARYLLDHSCIRKNVKRPHAGVYFGVVSYRKLKVTPEVRRSLCPICKHDLHKLLNFGGDDFVHEAFVRVFDEHKLPLWVEDTVKRGYRGYERSDSSESYERY